MKIRKAIPKIIYSKKLINWGFWLVKKNVKPIARSIIKKKSQTAKAEMQSLWENVENIYSPFVNKIIKIFWAKEKKISSLKDKNK